MAINPAWKASYLASLFMAKKLSLKDFSKVIPSGEIITIPTFEPFWFLPHLQTTAKLVGMRLHLPLILFWVFPLP